VRILALTSSYPRFEGDATAPFIESIITHVVRLGHEVHLVVPEDREWSRPPSEDGLHFHPFRYSPVRTWTPWGYSQSLQAGVRLHKSLYALAPVVLFAAQRTCRALARRERFDVLHAHWLVPNGLILARMSEGIGLPLVVSLHGSDISVPERSRWMRPFVRRTFARTAAVTAPSADLLDRAKQLGAGGILELIPYGADTETIRSDQREASRRSFGLEDSDVMVLGIGRFVHWKGFDVLIDAVARLRASTPSVRLVFAGDGDLREALVARVRDLDLADRVSFAGMVGREDVPSYFAAADVVAVPSVHYKGYVDGLPNVALEAMAAGKPVVSTNVGGLPDVIKDGENGFLVEEDDAAQLAEAIRRLAVDSALRTRMGEKGRALIRESLNWDAVARSFVAVFERVAA
jgi:glycosyltransferase involved in cell wall biosynthesis